MEPVVLYDGGLTEMLCWQHPEAMHQIPARKRRPAQSRRGRGQRSLQLLPCGRPVPDRSQTMPPRERNGKGGHGTHVTRPRMWLPGCSLCHHHYTHQSIHRYPHLHDIRPLQTKILNYKRRSRVLKTSELPLILDKTQKVKKYGAVVTTFQFLLLSISSSPAQHHHACLGFPAGKTLKRKQQSLTCNLPQNYSVLVTEQSIQYFSYLCQEEDLLGKNSKSVTVFFFESAQDLVITGYGGIHL